MQYLALIDDSPKTLLQQTLERLRGLVNPEDPILIYLDESLLFLMAK